MEVLTKKFQIELYFSKISAIDRVCFISFYLCIIYRVICHVFFGQDQIKIKLKLNWA